ncbi:MAG: O-antigen ligase family protein [Bacteroidales bacterium]|jgi:O-antigen ligase/5S rRNA maturation endonuclease (ribonuclease M5)|nr:O-antigen ligase family protein [Bacteroidales bacterium]
MALPKMLKEMLVGEKKFRLVFLLALAVFLTGIPFSRFLMSLAGVILAVNWILEGNLIAKTKKVCRSPVVWICLLVYLVHILWLIPSENLTYGMQDLWIKIPLFFVPVVFCTASPLSRKEFQWLLQIYIIGVLISTFSGFFTYLFGSMADKREMALYISYVRLEINVCFACYVCLFLVFQKEIHKFNKAGIIAALCWFLFFMIFSGSMTAIALFFIVGLILIVRQAIKSKNVFFRYFVPSLFLMTVIATSACIYSVAKRYFKTDFAIETAAKYTSDGNQYFHDASNTYIENGSYVFTYICDSELEKAWNKRSCINFSENDKNGYSIRTTLIRYLNSKGLRKDRQGVEALTPEDISNIENSIANVKYTHKINAINRLYVLMWEIGDYCHTGSVKGYSMAQRLDLWRNSLSLIKKQPWLGVGTGDVKDAFAKELEINHSSLAGTNMRSHNQYFSFAIAFGIIGLILIVFSFIYPTVVLHKWKDPLFLTFFLIVLLSMFTEDTLEPQDGVTFFAFFYSFFLFLNPKT